MTHSLLLVGCGNMGRAMLFAWLEAGLVGRAAIVKPSPLDLVHPSVEAVPSPEAIPAGFRPDMVVLAATPQVLGSITAAYRRYAGLAPFLSIAAGKTLAFFARELGEEAAVIRSMPNIPSLIGQGVTGCAANARCTEADKALATRLLEAIGTVHWIEESEMNALTALSGNGPAYVFLLEEVLTRAGAALGLSEALSGTLARETILGSAAYMAASEASGGALRQRQMLKGGTTEAAMQILMENDALFSIYTRALQVAAARAGELAD